MPPSDAAISAPIMRSPLPAMAWTELRMGLRSGYFRFVALLLFLLGWSVGGVGGRGVGMSAYATGETACQSLGVVVALWTALGALRDTALRTDVLVFTKPQPPERLGLVRYLGLYGQILCFLLALFLGAIVGRLIAEGNLLGFPAYGLQFLRAAGVLFFASSAAYALALLAESPIAGGLIGLYWIVAMAGKAFLAKIYFPWYTQNLPGYVCLGFFLLGLTLWFSRRRLRGQRPAAPWTQLLVVFGLSAGSWLLWVTVRDGHDPMLIQSPALLRMADQTFTNGEITPGFILPDQNGKPTSLSQFPGRILLVALWSPRDPDSTLLLAKLQKIHEDKGAQGVLPIAICLSEDSSAAPTFAIGEHLSYPLVYDWGTYNGVRQMETSPIAIAYQSNSLPRVVITDRRRRVRDVLEALSSYETTLLDDGVAKRLAEEPE